MPGLLTTASVLMCPHGGTVQATTTNAQVAASGVYLVRAADTFTVAGCPFILGLVPHPCVLVQWVQLSPQARAGGDFVLTEASVGLCLAPDGAVQGTVLVNFTQQQVTGQ